jgi:hypothetical protein
VHDPVYQKSIYGKQAEQYAESVYYSPGDADIFSVVHIKPHSVCSPLRARKGPDGLPPAEAGEAPVFPISKKTNYQR